MGTTHFNGLIFVILPRFNLGGLFLVRFFQVLEKSHSNIWGIYEITPQPQEIKTAKQILRDLRFLRFEISREKF